MGRYPRAGQGRNRSARPTVSFLRPIPELFSFLVTGRSPERYGYGESRNTISLPASSTGRPVYQLTMSSTRGTWLLFSAGMALSLLVEAASAQSSCGHYVKSHSPERSSMQQDASPAHRLDTDASAPMHMPCSGPGCSENHKPLTPPSAPPAGHEQDRWGQTTLVRKDRLNTSCLLAPEPGRLRPGQASHSVFHPPR